MNLKVPLLKDKKITSEKLRIENKKMELRLQQLKLAMSKEKEERLSSGNQSNWATGSPGALLNYKPNISGIDSGKKIRLKMLKDEVTVLPTNRPSIIKSNILKDILSEDVLLAKHDLNIELNRHCGQCEEIQAAVNCKECAEDYCPKCFATFHLKGALRKHRSTPISTLTNRVSIPSPLFKPPDLKNISNNAILERKLSSSNLSERKSKKSNPPTNQTKLESPENSKENDFPKYSGSSLADGTYNEEVSNQYFQEAMQAWRNGVEIFEPPLPHIKQSTIEHSTETIPTDKNKKLLSDLIQFTPSLSYAEQLLLRKHRNNQLAPVEMKYILDRMAKTNAQELLENQRLLQSNLVLETSLINSSTETALKNDQFHIDFDCVNQLLNEAACLNERKSSMTTEPIIKSPFKIEDLTEQHFQTNQKKMDEFIQETVKPNMFDVINDDNPEMNNNNNNNQSNSKLTSDNSKRSKSAINRNNFYDQPLSARKTSARTNKGGNITTKPSVLLDVLAQFSNYLPPNADDVQESLSNSNNKRPASANAAKPSNKISYNFYKLAPNSWKPNLAWTDVSSDETNTDKDCKINNSPLVDDDQLDDEIRNELQNLNLLGNTERTNAKDCRNVSEFTPSRKSSVSDEDDQPFNEVIGNDFNKESEDEETIHQLQSMERELTQMSRQENKVNRHNYDEILADSLDLTNVNDCLNSLDSDKFCFEDSLDFEQRYSNNSNTLHKDCNDDDDEELFNNCSSRFDDYDDVHKLN